MALPTLIQSIATEQTGGSSPYTHFDQRLPHPSQAGNCLVLVFSYTGNTSVSSATPAVTDDQGNTWTLGVSHADATNVDNLAIYYALNVTAATRRVRVTFSGDTAIAYQAILCEFNNVATAAAADGSNHTNNVAGGNSWQSGSFTTAVNGDLIFQAGVADAGATTLFTPDTGYSIAGSDLINGMCAQWAVQATAGATNPTITTAGAPSWISCTLALKSASAGGAPSLTAPRIAHIAHCTVSGLAGTFSFQVPTRGKAIVIKFVGASNNATVPNITSVTDSKGNTYTVGTRGGSSNVSGVVQSAYCLNPTTDNALTITVNTNGADHASNVLIYDIEGPTLSFDKIQTATGNDTVGGGTLSTVAITPAAANGIVLGAVSVQSGLLEEATGTNQFADQANSIDSIGNSPFDQDNGWAHIVPSSASAITFAWHDRATQSDNWASEAISLTLVVAGPTPQPAHSLNEARAHNKVASRLHLLRERGKGWFQAIFPAVFPLRNTTLVPAKWIVLSSRIGATAIQRATTGVIAAIVGGRVGGERRTQRSIAARGRFFGKAGVQMRVPTGTPATWMLSSSILGSGTIQRPTTGTVAATFEARSHGDKPLTRRIRAAGRAIAQRWLPGPPLQPTPKIVNAFELGRARATRNATRRARSSGHVLAQRWLPGPPPPTTPPTPKPAFCVIMGRSRSEHLRTVRQATIIAYDVAFLILPQPNTPALPGAHGLTITLRADRARRTRMQHERATSSSWSPAVRLSPPFPPLPLPRRMMAEHRTAWAHRAHARHEQHASFAGTQILLGPRVPPAPPPIVVDDRRRRWRGAMRG